MLIPYSSFSSAYYSKCDRFHGYEVKISVNHLWIMLSYMKIINKSILIYRNLVFVGNGYIMVASDISKLTLVYNRLSKDNTVYHFPFFHFFSFPSVMSLLLHYPAFTMPLHLPSSLKHIRQYILCCVHLKCKQRCLNLV